MSNRAARRKAAAARHNPTVRPASATGASHAASIATPATVEPEALVVTHWFDPGIAGEPYSATLRLTGHRMGVQGRPTAQDTFVHEETLEHIVPGSGPVTVSSWVYGLRPGEWAVSAEPLRSAHPTGKRVQGEARPLQRANWSWRRRTIVTITATPIRTRLALTAPLARIPAVVPGIWGVLCLAAVLVAFAVQAVMLAHVDVPSGPALGVSMLVLACGLLGAKVWYAVLHPGPWPRALMGGWAVDGFFVTALVVAIAALVAFGLPVGRFLDASVPGIFFAVAIGRLGCFFAGCCAGRCTRVRWGVWSSDRRIGARRIPAPLLESTIGLLIGGVSAFLILSHLFAVEGVIAVMALGGYAIIRQALLRLRAERREYSWRRSHPAISRA